MTLKNLTRITKSVSALTPQDIGALPVNAVAADASKLEGLNKAQVIAEARANLVNKSRTINGKTLAADIILTHADVGAIALTQIGVAGGIASLDGSGKIPTSQIPSIAIKDTFVVESEKEQLALIVEKGDIAIRSDIKQTFILSKEPANNIENWTPFATPTDAVLSVNGHKGVVNLGASDVGAEPKILSKGTAFNKSFGTVAGTVAEGNDSRIVNAVQNTLTINNHALNKDITLTHADVGALGETEKAVDSALLDGETKAQIIAKAKAGLAVAANVYTKVESDAKFLAQTDFIATLKDSLFSLAIAVNASSSTVTIPGSISSILSLAVSGATQQDDAYSLSGNTLTFGDTLLAGDVVTVIGFK